MEYFVAAGRWDLHDDVSMAWLSDSVESLLNDGWELHGQLIPTQSVCQESGDRKFQFYQAMVRRGKRVLHKEESIEFLCLSTRSHNALTGEGILSVQELCDRTRNQLLEIFAIGKKSIREIEAVLATHGYALRGEQR